MTASEGALTGAEARWALAQIGLAEMHGLLAYSEAFAVIAAGVTVQVEPPERLVRQAVRATLRGELKWQARAHTFPTHLRKAVRLEVAGRLALHARLRGHAPQLWEARLGPAQIGDLRGLEQLAHWAGEMNAHVRSNDAALLEAAIKLTDLVRGQLQALVTDPDDEDTARISRPVLAMAAPTEAPGT